MGQENQARILAALRAIVEQDPTLQNPQASVHPQIGSITNGRNVMSQSNEIESPMDKILGLLSPLTDPGNIGVGSGPQNAVTLFANPAIRKRMTEAFKQGAKRAGPEYAYAAEEFANKYPRIAAHMKPSVKTKDRIYEKGGQSFSPAASMSSTESFVAKQMDPQFAVQDPRGSLNIYPAGRVEPGDLWTARNIISHEGTHAAQALGNKDFQTLYRLANAMEGYHSNPFEITARRAGEAAAHEMPNSASTTAIEMLRRRAERALTGPAIQGSRGHDILNILDSRKHGKVPSYRDGLHTPETSPNFSEVPQKPILPPEFIPRGGEKVYNQQVAPAAPRAYDEGIYQTLMKLFGGLANSGQ